MNWKTVTLFISSTFNDMHDERDFIKRYVVNRLNETLEPHHISVQVTDLRWGIDTHNLREEEQEQKVLHICMDAIENSRPYFIGILGHRYGWVPDSKRMKAIREQYSILDEQPCSVTEMEIMLGAISRKDYLDHSFFFFRDISSYDEMDAETRSFYIDGENGLDIDLKKRQKLNSLKNRIQNALSCFPKRHVYEYQAQWDGEHFVGLDSFGNLLYEALVDDILEKESVSQGNQEDFSLASFIHNKSSMFTGHTSMVNDLVNWAKAYSARPLLNPVYPQRPANGVVLTAPSGSGKSALWSRLACLLEEDGANLFTVVAGSSEQTMSFYQIRNRIKILPRGTIIMIDGIDRLSDCKGLADFLSSNSMFGYPYICTCTDEYFDVFNEEFRFYQSLSDLKGSFKRISLPSISRSDAEKLINDILSANNKELSTGITATLLKSVMSGDGMMDIYAPFRLRIALNILMEMGSDDFRRIRSLSIGDDAHKIESYLKAKVESFPASLSDLIQYFIKLTIDLFEPELAKGVLVNLSLSRFGLSAEDLEVLCGECWDSLEFGSLCFWLRSFIQKDALTGKYYLSHSLIKEAVSQLFRKDLPRYQDVFESVIVERFRAGRIGIDEYLYSLIRCHDIHLFYDMLEKEGMHSYALGAYFLDDEEDGFRFLREFFQEYRDYPFMDEVFWAISAGYTDETSRCKRLVARAKAIQNGLFTKEELLSGNFRTLFSYFSVILSRLDEHPELFDEMHTYFLENKAKYGAELAQKNLVDTYFFCWGKHFHSLHHQFRSIYDDECRLAQGGPFNNDRFASRQKKMERSILRDLHVLLDECQWFHDNATIIATICLYKELWGGDRMYLTGKTNWDTDIMERIVAYQLIQSRLWSLYGSVCDSSDKWLVDYFNHAAEEVVEKYRNLFCIFSNTPFQPTELSEYVDCIEAVKRYRKLADQGDANAQNNLGVCYRYGRGVAQDYVEAVKWYRKSAEQGNATAQYNLGVCYRYGRGVVQDYAEAVKWYRKSADQGYASAQLGLGLCYEKGRGVAPDSVEAVKWYRKSAEQGNATAQYNLGVCYENGHGVAKDSAEAIKWYKKSAAQGNVNAKKKLER